jgi:Kdo2-lipid IVA lauroyltransferase/acyltransferase
MAANLKPNNLPWEMFCSRNRGFLKCRTFIPDCKKMRAILFYLLYGFIRLMSLLPIRMLYGLSDLVCFFLYYLIPYRKKLVFKNLRNSFPEWDEKEVKRTAKRFYHFFCDFFLESALFIFLKDEELMKRFRYKNPELLNELYDRGKSVMLVFGHYGNWEWSATLPRYIRHTGLGVYKPLHINYIDKVFLRSRERFGVVAVPAEKIARVLAEYRQAGKPTKSYFVADQRPLLRHIQYWTTMLNQDTPFVLGPEKLAKKLDAAVVYFRINRTGRGYYECEFSLITDEPLKTKEFEITESFRKLLENQIRDEPAYWLWTHNRWKHSKEEFYKRYGHRESIRHHPADSGA